MRRSVLRLSAEFVRTKILYRLIEKRYVQGSRYQGNSDLAYFVAYNVPHIAAILRSYGDRMDIRFHNIEMDKLLLKL